MVLRWGGGGYDERGAPVSHGVISWGMISSGVHQSIFKLRSRVLRVLDHHPKSQKGVSKKIRRLGLTWGGFALQHPVSGARPPKSRREGSWVGQLCPVRDLNSNGAGRKARWDRLIRMGAPSGRALIGMGPQTFAAPLPVLLRVRVRG